MKISVNKPLLLLKTVIHTVHRWIMNNMKIGLPLCHVVSWAMRCYDCARRMRTRAEHFSLLLQSRLWGYAVKRSESSFWLSNFTLYTPQLLDTHLGVATDTLMCVVSRHLVWEALAVWTFVYDLLQDPYGTTYWEWAYTALFLPTVGYAYNHTKRKYTVLTVGLRKHTQQCNYAMRSRSLAKSRG